MLFCSSFGCVHRAETDSQLIWFAFLFFVGCCAFVVLRRLRVIRVAISTACLACSVFSGLLSSLFSTLGATTLHLQESLLSSAPLAPSLLPPALPSVSPPPFSQSDGVFSEKNRLLAGLPPQPPPHAVDSEEAVVASGVSARKRGATVCAPEGAEAFASTSPSQDVSESCQTELASSQVSSIQLETNREALPPGPTVQHSPSPSASSPAASARPPSERIVDPTVPVAPASSPSLSRFSAASLARPPPASPSSASSLPASPSASATASSRSSPSLPRWRLSETEEGRSRESSAAMEGEARGGQTLKVRGDSPGSTAAGDESAEDDGGEGDADELDEGEVPVRIEEGESEERGDKEERRDKRDRQAGNEREEKDEREHTEGERNAQGNNGDATRERSAA
ncbi:Sec20 protein [Toxoplasma gondii p89]|uniref:Sec20 protein n=1 Tax=Toxoplasma gondii p89 TaxID=943119 RepID=A0A086K025_TOXGO|nr:Sec20 protein [Toxoplasma gondii p89]